MDPEHELVVGESVLQEGPRRPRQRLDIRPGFRRDDEMHRVARGLGTQRWSPLACSDPGIRNIANGLAAVVGRRALFDQFVESIGHTIAAVAGRAWREADRIHGDCGCASDPLCDTGLRASARSGSCYGGDGKYVSNKIQVCRSVPCATEADIFAFLGIDYKSPEERAVADNATAVGSRARAIRLGAGLAADSDDDDGAA